MALKTKKDVSQILRADEACVGRTCEVYAAGRRTVRLGTVFPSRAFAIADHVHEFDSGQSRGG
jgi:hypothetical protein